MWSHLTYITAHVETQNTSAGACFCKTLKGETEISKNKTDLYWFMKLDSLLFCTEVCVLSDKHLKDNCTILYMWRKKHLSWGWCQRGGHVVTQRCLHLPFKTRAIYFRSSLCFIYKALKCHHMKTKIIRYLWLSQISNKQGQSFLSVWLKWLADLPTYMCALYLLIFMVSSRGHNSPDLCFKDVFDPQSSHTDRQIPGSHFSVNSYYYGLQ